MSSLSLLRPILHQNLASLFNDIFSTQSSQNIAINDAIEASNAAPAANKKTPTSKSKKKSKSNIKEAETEIAPVRAPKPVKAPPQYLFISPEILNNGLKSVMPVHLLQKYGDVRVFQLGKDPLEVPKDSTASFQPTMAFLVRENAAHEELQWVRAQILKVYGSYLHAQLGQHDSGHSSKVTHQQVTLNHVSIVVCPGITLRLNHFLREYQLVSGATKLPCLGKQDNRSSTSSTRTTDSSATSQHSTLFDNVILCPRIIENTLACSLFFYDADLLTMQYTDAWKLIQLNQDRHLLYEMAKVLSKLELLLDGIGGTSSHGVNSRAAPSEWANIAWKGDASHQIVQMMQQLNRQMGRSKGGSSGAGSGSSQQSAPSTTRMTHLFLLDRDVDLLSPLLTGHSYEALVDEHFGVEFGGLFRPPFQPCIPESKPGDAVKLDAKDTVYSEIRDMHVDVLGKRLKRIGEQLQERVEQRKHLETIQDIKAYTEQLPHLQRDMKSYATHLNIIQQIRKLTAQHEFQQLTTAELNICKGKLWKQSRKYIAECIAKQDELDKVLRLLCLASLANKANKFPLGGLTSDDYTFFRNEILETYGYDKIITLENLERMGLFLAIDSNVAKLQAAAIAKRTDFYASSATMANLNYYFQLEVKPKDKNPDPFVEDPAEVDFDPHRIYVGNRAPLSVQLLQKMSSDKTWNEEVFKYVPGHLGRILAESTEKTAPKEGTQPDTTQGRPLALVVYVGGITLEEMNAIRGLNRINAQRYNDAIQKSAPVPKDCFEYVVLTTNVLYKEASFVSSFVEHEEDL